MQRQLGVLVDKLKQLEEEMLGQGMDPTSSRVYIVQVFLVARGFLLLYIVDALSFFRTGGPRAHKL